MTGAFLKAGLAALTFLTTTACATTSEPRPTRLSAEPDAAQAKVIADIVREAMGRNDLSMEPARLFYNSELVVRPVAIPGLTDRVPGTPTRFVLMTDGAACWLTDRSGDMRIDLPDVSCQ